MNVLPITSRNANFSQSFKGEWKTEKVQCYYPYENCIATVHTYIADPEESFDEIRKNYTQRSHRSDIFDEFHGSTYSVNENYFTDLSKNYEAQKKKLTESAERKLKENKYEEAVLDKLVTASILRKQGKEHDKFLVEESIRDIYNRAYSYIRTNIEKLVSIYNFDMAKDLCNHVHIK